MLPCEQCCAPTTTRLKDKLGVSASDCVIHRVSQLKKRLTDKSEENDRILVRIVNCVMVLDCPLSAPLISLGERRSNTAASPYGSAI